MFSLLKWIIIIALTCLFSMKAGAKIIDDYQVTQVCKTIGYRDCSLVGAIVSIESGHNVHATLNDCIGLMQVKCSTAQFMGLKNCVDLKKEEVAIKYGIKYLMYIESLIKSQNYADILSVYNAGYRYIAKTNSYAPKKYNGKYVNESYIKLVLNKYMQRPENIVFKTLNEMNQVIEDQDANIWTKYETNYNGLLATSLH